MEFVEQTEVHSMRSVIDGVRNKTIQLKAVKRNVGKGLVISKPVEMIPGAPKLLTKSDIFVISDIRQKPKMQISKDDISTPIDFIHMQHGGTTSQFTVATDNPKLKVFQKCVVYMFEVIYHQVHRLYMLNIDQDGCARRKYAAQ